MRDRLSSAYFSATRTGAVVREWLVMYNALVVELGAILEANARAKDSNFVLMDLQGNTRKDDIPTPELVAVRG